MDMHRVSLSGRLPIYIAEFLKHRTLNVKIGNYMSERKVQQNGVPQGSVLSVTLFALKINGIIGQIPKDRHFHYSLYVDDLQTGYHHTDTNVIQRALQQCINQICSWSSDNGFKFSPRKCKAMHFNILQGLHISPILTLNNYNIQYWNEIKFYI